MSLHPAIDTQSKGKRTDTDIIKVAIMAVGGQGGGVLTNWVVAMAEANGYRAQSTSVAGVAQRTGATIYYVEMAPDTGSQPVFSLAPAAGDVDVLIAAEMMESGRAIMRGFVTPDRTALITSTHRALAVQEKMEPGDGVTATDDVVTAAELAARSYIAFDMERIAEDAGSVISASLFGALAGADVLPFKREAFEETINLSGRGIDASLRAFSKAYDIVSDGSHAKHDTKPVKDAVPPARATGPKAAIEDWERLLLRLQGLPGGIAKIAQAGLTKVVDFQDIDYGREYLLRLEETVEADLAHGGETKGFALSRAAAKHIANAMAYDDVIRVADLKTRATRFARVRSELGVDDSQVLTITEYFHPRGEEVCAMLPAKLGRRIENSPRLFRILDRMVNRGRRIRTDTVMGFGLLYAIAGLRRRRRSLRRHEIETTHIDHWLDGVRRQLPGRYDLAVELTNNRRLIKGYSDTHTRGLSKFDRVNEGALLVEDRDDAADWVRRLRDAALKDEAGVALDGALETVRSFATPLH